MNPSLTIDSRNWSRTVARYVDELGMDAPGVVKTQSRLFLKQVMSLTPPRNLGQGRKAVARDLRRAMRPIVEDDFKSPRIKRLIRSKDMVGFQAFLKRTKKLKAHRILPFSKGLHRTQRDNRGRVQGDKRVLVFAAAEWRKYLAQVQKGVGLLRAGWLRGYLAVGGNDAPDWVSRNISRAQGNVQNDLGNKTYPSVTITNYAGGANSLRSIVKTALESRAVNMAKDIQRRLKDLNGKHGL